MGGADGEIVAGYLVGDNKVANTVGNIVGAKVGNKVGCSVGDIEGFAMGTGDCSPPIIGEGAVVGAYVSLVAPLSTTKPVSSPKSPSALNTNSRST